MESTKEIIKQLLLFFKNKMALFQHSFSWYVSYYRYHGKKYVEKYWKLSLEILLLSSLFYLAKKYTSTEFVTLYCILLLFYVIFRNLDRSGKRSSLSAYSVFNKNFQKVAGTFDAQTIDKTLRGQR